MKLLTEMHDDGCGGQCLSATHSGMRHDAACAHALMLAMSEWWNASDGSGIDETQSPRETMQWVEARAQAIFREWGFDSGEVEGER